MSELYFRLRRCALLLLLTAAWPLSAQTLAQPSFDAMNANKNCMSCHADSDIQSLSEDKIHAGLYVSPAEYGKSVHKNVPCVACHESQPNSSGFAVTPHESVPVSNASCESCHSVAMSDTINAFNESVHHKLISQKDFSCTACHNPHTMTTTQSTPNSLAAIAQSNGACIECHSRAGEYSRLAQGKTSKEQDLAHSMLPYAKAHLASLRCVDCHVDVNDKTLHRIQPAEKAVDCQQCHKESGALLARTSSIYKEESTMAGSLLGQGLFDDSKLVEKIAATQLPTSNAAADTTLIKSTAPVYSGYHFGSNGSDRLDNLICMLLVVIIIALVIHGSLRWYTHQATQSTLEKHYLYTLPVRIWHWLNALCFIVLLISGAAIHFVHSQFAWWVSLHNIAGLTLCAVWGLFILVLITGNGHHYRVKCQGFMTRVIRQSRYYLYGIFRSEAHPEHASEAAKFNILQQLGYLFIMFICLPLIMVTGLMMYLPELTPERLFGLAGKQVIAYLHYGTAVILLMFMLVHLYLSTTGATVSALVKGMVDGYHREHHD